MPIVCGIKFRGSSKVYFFSPGDLTNLLVGDHVIVDTARGREMGQVAAGIHEVDDAAIVGQLKPIVRRSTTSDLLDAQRYQRQEAEAVERCKEQVARHNLPMKVVSAEYSYDGSRLTFFFSSEQRVDFRELVRELARIFRVRIELRQIGVRDEARSVGGVGKCGRSICCATWLNEFCPVSIRMAKQQDLPLSPMEISGLCGRLLCCLGYENDYYQSVRGRFPKVGKTVSTPMGPAKVIGVSVLRETVALLFEDGSTTELTADELAGKAPIHHAEVDGLTDEQVQALDELMAEGDDDNGRSPGRPSERTIAPRGESASAPQTSQGRDNSRAAPGRPTRERPPASQTPAVTTAQPGSAEAMGDQGASPAGPGSGRSRRRRPRRPRGERPAAQQGETAAAPAPAAPAAEDGQERAQPSRRRPRRRRSRQASNDQSGAPPEG